MTSAILLCSETANRSLSSQCMTLHVCLACVFASLASADSLFVFPRGNDWVSRRQEAKALKLDELEKKLLEEERARDTRGNGYKSHSFGGHSHSWNGSAAGTPSNSSVSSYGSSFNGSFNGNRAAMVGYALVLIVSGPNHCASNHEEGSAPSAELWRKKFGRSLLVLNLRFLSLTP